MFPYEIKFKDLDGNDVTDTFYFHLYESELAELSMGTTGSLGKQLITLVQTEKNADILAQFKAIIKMAYGVRGEDNRRFIKTDENWLAFYQSDAYNRLFMRLIQDSAFVSEFFNRTLPADLAEKLDLDDPEALARHISDVQNAQKPVETVAVPWEDREPTRQELATMTREELFAVTQRKFGIKSEN